MNRLLIVDDEPIIVDGMAGLFQETCDLELEICKAYSGDEALEWLDRMKIDIVLSDIRMPGMSGLELLKYIHGQWPHCKVIFLTAHDDTEYIRTALRFGGVDYLLKTESEDTIVDSVRRALQASMAERREMQVLENAKTQLKMAEPMLRRQVLLGACDGTKPLRGETAELAHEVNLPFAFHQPVLLLIGRVDRWREGMTPGGKAMLRYAVDNIAQEMLSMCVTQAVDIGDSRLVWFLQPAGMNGEHEASDKDWEKTIRFVHGTLETVQTVCRDLLQIPVSFASGSRPVPWHQAHSAYESLSGLIGRGLGLGKESLLIEGQEQYKTAGGLESKKRRVRQLIHQTADFETWLEKGLSEAYLNLLRDVQAEMESFSGETVFFHEIYYSLAIPILTQINKWGKEAELSERGIPTDRLANVQLHADQSEAFGYLFHTADELFQAMENERKETTNQLVTTINRYIEDHLDQDLCLTGLSGIVHLNANYLSRLYKQMTGVGIIDYITNMRIARAKHLLQQTFLRVHEISKAVGFENPAYFARIFRKHTGISPQEYRDAIRMKE